MSIWASMAAFTAVASLSLYLTVHPCWTLGNILMWFSICRMEGLIGDWESIFWNQPNWISHDANRLQEDCCLDVIYICLQNKLSHDSHPRLVVKQHGHRLSEIWRSLPYFLLEPRQTVWGVQVECHCLTQQPIWKLEPWQLKKKNSSVFVSYTSNCVNKC